MCLEAVVGEYAGLGKAIHAFGDLHHDHVVVDEGGKSILFDYIAGDPFDGDPHVLVLRHGGVEIKFFNVYVHVFCVGGGDDAVEMEFDGGKVGSGSGDFAGVDDFVAADGESDSVLVGFVWLKGCDDAEVGGNSALGFFGMFNETHGVGPRGGVGEAPLGEAANFEGGAVDPFEGVEVLGIRGRRRCRGRRRRGQSVGWMGCWGQRRWVGSWFESCSLVRRRGVGSREEGRWCG